MAERLKGNGNEDASFEPVCHIGKTLGSPFLSKMVVSGQSCDFVPHY